MNNFKKSLKASNGITLIALVITIIVLLILAGISISMLSGDNGILKKAGDAKTYSDEAQIKERIQLAYHSALAGGQGSYTKESLEDELEKEFGENNYNVDDSDDKTWILSAKGQSVIIPAGKKSSTPSGKLSKEQLKTKIENESSDCMIDDNGNIIPINIWRYYITGEDTCKLEGYEDDDSGDYFSAYNGQILEDGSLEFGIPVYIKKENKSYLVNKLGGLSLATISGLKEVKIPDNIESLGFGVFSCCTSLTTVTMPNSITCIERNTFEFCHALTDFVIPDSVTQIKNEAFRDCSALKTIEIPNSVTSIGYKAFSNSGLISVTIPNSVTEIGGEAFWNCTTINSINIPNSVTQMEQRAFYNWTSSQIININFKQNELPSGWDSNWKTGCNAQINYAQ